MRLGRASLPACGNGARTELPPRRANELTVTPSSRPGAGGASRDDEGDSALGHRIGKARPLPIMPRVTRMRPTPKCGFDFRAAHRLAPVGQ